MQSSSHSHCIGRVHALIKKQLDVRITQNTLELFYRGNRVASHRRSYQKGHPGVGWITALMTCATFAYLGGVLSVRWIENASCSPLTGLTYMLTFGCEGNTILSNGIGVLPSRRVFGYAVCETGPKSNLGNATYQRTRNGSC